MSWITIVIVAYFLNAISVTADKFLLSKKIPNPAVYAFFISIFNLFALVLIPFGFHFASPAQIIIALLAGAAFAFALLYMFKALSENDASRVVPFLGGLQPIFVLALAWIFLQEKLGGFQLLALAFIIIGTLVISWEKKKSAAHRSSYLWALIATLLFAIFYTASKYIYLEQGFVSGFIWTRVGAFVAALSFLLIPRNRRDILGGSIASQKSSGPLFIFGQICGGLSFILVNYAIEISSSVAIVNALQGLQYVFLLIIIVVLGRKFPKLLKEKMAGRILAQKLLATALIIAGLVFISL